MYHIRVRAVAGSFKGAWSDLYEPEMYSRIHCAPPAVPEIVDTSDDPCQLAGERAFTFAWDAAEGAESYEVQVSKYNTFDPVIRTLTTPATSATATVPEDGRTYHWRVRAVNPAGTSDWSALATVCVGDPPIPCSQMTTPNEGRQGFHTYNHDLGATAGWVRLTYNMYTIEDKIDVYYDGDLVATTGDYVSGTGTIWF